MNWLRMRGKGAGGVSGIWGVWGCCQLRGGGWGVEVCLLGVKSESEFGLHFQERWGNLVQCVVGMWAFARAFSGGWV